eukprot:SAG11_NODE_14717_length_602_cov_1.037773_1_plen_69_part_00
MRFHDLQFDVHSSSGYSLDDSMYSEVLNPDGTWEGRYGAHSDEEDMSAMFMQPKFPNGTGANKLSMDK